jgi:hypothetical protein
VIITGAPSLPLAYPLISLLPLLLLPPLPPEGIPYAPHLDPWIVLKKQHLDDAMHPKALTESSALTPQAQAMRMLSGTSSTVFSGNPPSSSRNKLSGQGWYVQSASRAVNQAMGRVIRHQKDWGVIFLLDSRLIQMLPLTSSPSPLQIRS